ncbi:TPA: protein rep [Staphylococcus aureus]|jgi:plasmid rolling circle replication initiator protein Rep|uniref:Replication protein n=13 Tax=Bacillales TaxID=1385 RepID=A0A2T4LPE9_9STAP|nr:MULTISPECIES: protein rep [Staphylococcus]EAE5991512.1 replication protein [Listeria monocytogenes]EMB9430853.1 protein rep [Staphylococcus pseudintermedius]MDU7039230.1 protein rep [Lactococcus lactis]MDW4350310.1 protein rep [Staphylococcus saprophyticus]EJD91103.1 rep family protein [Staphylococcus epidermidis NIHLM061]
MEKYTEKKQRNQVFQKFIKRHIGENQMDLVQDCNTFLSFVADKTLEKQKLYKANSCKNRFCPVCAWRKARKDALGLSLMMQYIKQQEKKEFIFLTLTTPNVMSDELENEIKRYNNSFRKLIKRKKVGSVIKGYVRKLEITYNKKRDDYNPHFHVLIAVNKSYFKDTKSYISQKEWLNLWRDVTGMPEITQVQVQKIRQNNNKELYEMAKYSGKDSDYLINQKVFDAYYRSLKGKQVLVYSGLFKEARKLLKNGDLDYLKEIDPTEYIYQIFYIWKQKEYLASELHDLTEQEKRELNHQMIDEIEEET